jgi:putative NADPH-quinone reductase
MRISVILAHPNPESFNHAIAQTVVDALKVNGYRAFFHDLYQEKFDPRLTLEELANDAILPPVIRKHCDEIASADGIVIVHPNWWGQPPAILKGWVDRVIRPGVAYEFTEGDSGEGIPNGLLKARVALVFNTSNTKSEREEEVFGDPLETIWKNCVFGLCGVNNFHRRMFNVIVTSTDDQRRDWLIDVEKDINHFFPKDAA